MTAAATRVRPAAVAGLFYPRDRGALRATVDALLLAAPAPPDEPGPPVALIAPHAALVYSGPVAATAYRRLAPWHADVTRVVLLGPAHRVPVSGLALSGASAFATPLGDVPLDVEACAALQSRSGLRVDDTAHAGEHCLEIQLPFLQRVLDRFTIVPLLVGHARAEMVADALEELWGAEGTVVVVSSDLSHYHDHATAQRLDARTAAAIVARDPDHVSGDDACGAAPVRAALTLARRHGEQVAVVDLRTSADTAGDPGRVVGYGAFVIR